MTSQRLGHIGILLPAPWVGALVWTLVGSCMRAEAQRRGIRVTSLGATSMDDQVMQLGELLDLKVDAVVMKPMSTDHPGIADMFLRAKASRVPIVTFDSVIEHEAVVCTVGTDNAKAQAEATEFAFARLGHRGKVVFFRGDDRLASGATRNASFHEVLSRYPHIELVFEATLDWVTPMWRPGFGASCMRAALAAAPQIDAVIATSDESALGAISVLAEVGLAGKVIVVGFDGLPEALLAIHDGTLAATVPQRPESIAERAFDVVSAIRDQLPVPRLSRVEATLVTRDNIIDSALGSLRLVSRLISDLGASHNAQRELQHDMERQREALRQSEKLSVMGSLLAGVAHELNNPLAIAMGRASLLEEKCEDPDLREDARRIREATDRCGRVVRMYVDMARGKPLRRTAVSLNHVARAAIDMLAYTHHTRGIRVETQLASDLPAVAADSDQISQVVVNLLVNAQQAVEGLEGGRRIVVQTGVQTPPEYRERMVWLRVIDSGPGMPPHRRASIFSPLVSTTENGLGTGLGLSMSRSLACAHGGDLTLETADGEAGSTFQLTLPIGDAPYERTASRSEPRTQPERLLVVDDEAEIARMVRNMLEGAGFEVATAESATVALKLLDTVRFDAIVSDIRMPDMDGAALWHEIAKRHAPLAKRVLFVTGDTLSPSASAFLEEAQCVSLDKPFTKVELLESVARILEQPVQTPEK